MKRIKNITKITIPIILVITLLMSGYVYADDETIEREYTFQATDTNNLYYKPKKEIKVKGEEYKYKDIRYEVLDEGEPLAITKTVTVTDPAQYTKEITKQVNGKNVTYRAVDPKWDKKTVKKAERKQFREYIDGETIPQKIEVGGQTYDLVDAKEGTREENFTIPAIFVSAGKDTYQYYIGGKLVKLNQGTDYPSWDGYKDDLKNALDIRGADYEITGIKWNGKHTQTDNGYEREALVSGKRTVHLTTVTYSNLKYVNSNTTTYYTANVKYVAEGTEVANVKAIVTYEKVPVVKPVTKEKTKKVEKKGLTTAQIIGISVGAVILILAIASILYYLAKRRRSEETEN